MSAPIDALAAEQLAKEIRETVPEVRRVQIWSTTGKRRLYVDLIGMLGRGAPCVFVDLDTREVHTQNWRESIAFHHRYGPTVDGVIRQVAKLRC